MTEFKMQVYPDGRLDTSNAALYLGLRPKTLAMWRSDGKGPKFIKRGRIFYFREDLDNWINEQGRFISTTQARLEISSKNSKGKKNYEIKY